MSESPQVPPSPLDDLLQIPTRAKLTSDLERLADASSSDQPLSVLWLDLDKFKQVNDLHGHEAGDEVLEVVASVIRTLCENKGRPYRYGGDEIVVLLPNHSTREAASLAERIRERVERLSFKRYPEPITASIGIASYPKPTQELRELLGVLGELHTVEDIRQCFRFRRTTPKSFPSSHGEYSIPPASAATLCFQRAVGVAYR